MKFVIKQAELTMGGKFRFKSSSPIFFEIFFLALNLAKSIYGKKSSQKKSKNYCKLICLANIPNFQMPLCEIEMLTNL